MKAQLWASLKFKIWIVQKMKLWLNGLAHYCIMFPTGKSQEFIGFPRIKKLFELHSFKETLLQTRKPMSFLLTNSLAPSLNFLPPFSPGPQIYEEWWQRMTHSTELTWCKHWSFKRGKSKVIQRGKHVERVFDWFSNTETLRVLIKGILPLFN